METKIIELEKKIKELEERIAELEKYDLEWINDIVHILAEANSKLF